MKKIIFFLMFISANTIAGTVEGSHPYFRLIDVNHPIVSAGVLFNPRDLGNTQIVSDVAIITHSTKDGTIIPSSIQSYLSPEDWVPLECGGGGNGNSAVVECGPGFNIEPTIANLALHAIDSSSSQNAQAIKQALTSGYSKSESPLSFAFGIKPTIKIVSNGVAQSLPEMFQGRGLGPIINNLIRYEVKLAYHF